MRSTVRARAAGSWGPSTSLVVLAVALTACGSTVPEGTAASGAGFAAGGGTEGLSGEFAGGLPGSALGEGPGGLPAASGNGLRVPDVGGSRPASDEPPGSSDTAQSRAGRAAGGATAAQSPEGGRVREQAGTVDVGMLYSSDYNTYTKRVGLENITTGDQRAEQQWFVDAINASGGVLGRRIRPVFHEIRASDSAEQVGSSACARFTQDQRVTAVAGGGGNQQLRACLQKAGIPHVGGGAAASRLTSAELRRHPLLVDVGGVSVDRLAAAMPEGLRRGGFPQANGAVPVKVGIVTYDAPAYRAAGDQLAAAFRRRGLSVAEVQFVRQDQDSSDLGVIANQMSGAVLRMRSENVTHMTFLEDHSVIGGLFMIQAENQNYRPYYGLSSGTLPQVLVGTAPDAQLARGVGFGWFPAADVAAPAQAKTPGYDRCLKILAAKGDRPSTANALGAALLLCDNIFAAAELFTAGGRADAQGFAAALRTGVAFPSATTFRSQLSTARQDGPSSYRPLDYRPDCRCFAYTGQPVAF